MTEIPDSYRPCPQCGTACAYAHQYCAGCGFPIGSLEIKSEDKLVGQALPGGYLVLELLSVGGMGRVYRAEQRALGRTVAVKVIHPHLLSDENSVMRFMTEARAASQLNHPNTVSVIDFGRTEDGQPYLVMEYLRGKDLARILHDEGQLSFERSAKLVRQVLHALTEAHELGIVHRDLKPENIILEPLRRGGDFVKVVDFGLAKLKADPSMPNVTMPGIVCGTPDFMAPEQGRGDALDGRSDLYAVGVILFVLLTGRLPFESENPTQVVMMHITQPVPNPREVSPRELPEELVLITLKALEKDPKDRFQEASEFAEALDKVITGFAVARTSMPAPPGDLVSCDSCAAVVPRKKFCGECGSLLNPAAPPSQITSPQEETRKVLELPLPLLGRDDDLLRLHQLLELSPQGTQVLRLVGVPGSGKSRLLSTFGKQAESKNAFVVIARPDPYAARVGFYALRSIITQLVGRPSGELREAPVQIPSALHLAWEDIYGAAPRRDDSRDIATRLGQYADCLNFALDLAHSRLGGRPLVICVDDVTQLDGASRGAIAESLLSAPERPDLIALLSHAPDAELGELSSFDSHTIGGISTNLVSTYLASVRSESAVAFPDNGHRGLLPLYVEQTVLYVKEGGSNPPSRLADLLAHRIFALDAAQREVLQALAVLGDGCTIAALIEVAVSPQRSEPEIQTAITSLIEALLIHRDHNQLELAHPLFRDIVMVATPVEVRRDLHRRALRAVSAAESPIEARAQHAFFAQASLEALLLLEQVAQRAAARGDQSAASLALHRALDIARQEIYRGELDDPLRAVAIFGRKLGESLAIEGKLADSEGILRETLDAAGPAGGDRAQILASLANVAHRRERPQEAKAYIDEAIGIAGNSGSFDLIEEWKQLKQSWTP